MNFQPWLEGQALGQMAGLPSEAPGALTRIMARICADPYDRMLSVAVRADDPAVRMAELGDAGFIEFTIDEAAGLVRVHALLWIG